MKSRALTVALLPIALSLAACTSVMFVGINDELVSRAPRGPEHAINVVEPGIPERPHKVIGSVRARFKLSPSTMKTWSRDKIIERLKDEARDLGGDALVGLEVTAEGKIQRWAATVIVWTEEE